MMIMTPPKDAPGTKGSKPFRWGIKRSLLSGILILTPITVTLLIIYWLFGQIRGLIRPLVVQMLDMVMDFPGAEGVPPIFLKILVVTATILMLSVMLYLLGMIGTRVMGKRLISFIEDLIKRVPFAGGLYGASKQVVEAFGGSDKPVYKSVVLVDFPRAGSKALGFLTGYVDLGGNRRYAKVIIPTAPNPTTGFFELFPADQIEKVNLTVEDAFKMILSVGLISPDSMAASSLQPEAD
jgi:uncharacterized membrane protein